MIYIIGEQKCGTTSLYDELLKLRGIRAPRNTRKEQHFFDSHRVLTSCRIISYNIGLGRRPGVVIDATPDYLADPIAAVYTAFLAPFTKIIVLTRNPTIRAHAAWDQNRRSGVETRTFANAVRDEFPTAHRCAHIAQELAQASSWISNATKSHFLLEYSERCLFFIQGRPRNCWVTMEYKERPACKRYLQKGLYGFHIAIWAKLYPPSQLAHISADNTLFASSFNAAAPTFLANLISFLNLPTKPNFVANKRIFQKARSSSSQKTCWHDCDKAKRKPADDLTPKLRQALDGHYLPSTLQLKSLINDGRITCLG